LRRVKVHDLRHTAASLLIAAGEDVTTVSRQLGHADAAVTLKTYTHWFRQRNTTGLGARLEEFLAREKSGCVLVVSGKSGASESTEVIEKSTGPGRIRTYDQGIMSPLH